MDVRHMSYTHPSMTAYTAPMAEKVATLHRSTRVTRVCADEGGGCEIRLSVSRP